MEKEFVFKKGSVVVETNKGKVRGYAYNGVSVFKGIPYAKAKRFHAPEPLEAWEGELDATSFGYVCPLLDMPKPAGEVFVPHRYWVMDEDCLNLNIWTPSCDEKKRPVLVWFHGGGFEAGSSIEHIAYEGENMSRRGDAVVVSINHRLNVLGYFDLSAFGSEYANSGNAGMDDIIASLKWVQENIEKFGGDPKNVTVFGQSGGGAKVTTLLQMPAADGLFAKGINMSGVINDLIPKRGQSGKEIAEAVMEELGVSSVKELEKVSYAQLAAAYLKVRPTFQAQGKYSGGAPIPNEFYVGDPSDVGFRKESSNVALMVGSVFGEFFTFAPMPFDRNHMTKEEGEKVVEKVMGEKAAAELLPLFEKAYPTHNPVDLTVLDTIVRVPLLDYVKERSKMNAQTYSYMFDLELPLDGGWVPWHCADIPYVFANTSFTPYTQEAGVTERVETEIFDSVMSFARTGDPNNSAIPNWPACTPDHIYTLVTSKNTRVECNYDDELMKVIPKYRPTDLRNHSEEEGQIQH